MFARAPVLSAGRPHREGSRAVLVPCFRFASHHVRPPGRGVTKPPDRGRRLCRGVGCKARPEPDSPVLSDTSGSRPGIVAAR